MKKKFIILSSLVIFSVLLFSFSVNIYITNSMKNKIYKRTKDIPKYDVALVLGAAVYGKKRMSSILYDRSKQAFELYKSGKVKYLLLSGDHGKKYYDEVGAMKSYFLKVGVPANKIYLDHAGFNTYDSVIRAKKIFSVKKMIIVTQEYHLPRALFIAKSTGIEVCGFTADRRKYKGMKFYKRREYLARIKSFLEVLINKKPKYLGHKIPIGKVPGQKSWD